MLADFVDRPGEADAALGVGAQFLELALAAAAGMDLRLDHPQRPGKLLRGLDRFFDGHRGIAGGHRHAELGEQFLGLIFVDVHGRALKQIGARKGSLAANALKFTKVTGSGAISVNLAEKAGRPVELACRIDRLAIIERTLDSGGPGRTGKSGRARPTRPQDHPCRHGRLLCVGRAARQSGASRTSRSRSAAVIAGWSRRRAMRPAPFGVRSAMPSVTAKRRCPELIFVKPRFDVYRAVSQPDPRHLRRLYRPDRTAVARRSLSRRDRGPARTWHRPGRSPRKSAPESRRRPASPHRPGSAIASSSPSSRPTRTSPTACASSRRTRARRSSPRCRSSASTGSARLPRRKWRRLGIHTGADLAEWPVEQLEAHFGSSGRWYWRIARGIDEREVKPDRPYKSVSAERTFDVDYIDAGDLRRELTRVAGYAWQRIERSEVKGRTVTLKVKFADFTHDDAVEELCFASARPSRVRGRRTGPFGNASTRGQGHQIAGSRASFDHRGRGVRAPATGTRNLIRFLLYNCHQPSRPAAVASYRTKFTRESWPDRGVAIGGRYGAQGRDASGH